MSTEDLSRIYQEHDEEEWTSEAFEVMGQILAERSVVGKDRFEEEDSAPEVRDLADGPASRGSRQPGVVSARTDSAADAPSMSPISERVLHRYSDAYLVADATTSIGTAVKVIGLLVAALIVMIGLAGAVQIDDGRVFVGSILAGVVVGIPLWVFGVHVSAQGQLLKASLDGAVHTSPFLDDIQRAKAMSLE